MLKLNTNKVNNFNKANNRHHVWSEYHPYVLVVP